MPTTTTLTLTWPTGTAGPTFHHTTDQGDPKRYFIGLKDRILTICDVGLTEPWPPTFHFQMPLTAPSLPFVFTLTDLGTRMRTTLPRPLPVHELQVAIEVLGPERATAWFCREQGRLFRVVSSSPSSPEKPLFRWPFSIKPRAPSW